MPLQQSSLPILGKLTLENEKHVFICHFLMSLFLFSNYFLFGQILIYSTDVLNLNLPVLITSKRSFLAGHLGLWNPYLLSGTSGFSYANLPVFSPDNWLHFLVPENHFIAAATLISFIKFWLIGIFSFLFFNEELKNKKWAFLASSMYQFSGYTLWSLMVYDVLGMVLFTTIAFYLIWSMAKRQAWSNYACLSIAFTLNILSSNIAYTSHAMLAIGVLYLYRFFSQTPQERNRQHTYCFLLAFSTSILLSAIRLLPVLIEIHSSNRQFIFSPSFFDTSFLALRLFDPEVLGISYRSSMSIIEGINDAFHGMHIQELMPQYFGVSAALLALWAVVAPLKGRINFWAFYVVFVLAMIAFIEPFDTLIKLINPVYHSLSLHIFFPVGFCMLAGYAAKTIEGEIEGNSLHEKPLPVLLFIIIAIPLYIFAVWAANFHEKLGLMRILAFFAVIAGFASFMIHRHWPQTVKAVCWSLAGLLFVFLLYMTLLYQHPNKTYLSHLKILSASLLMLMLIHVFLLISAFNRTTNKRPFWLGAMALFFLALIVVLYPWPEAIRDLPDRKGNFILAMLGLVRFIMVTAIFGTAFLLIRLRKFPSAWLFPLLLSVLFCEQLPASKIHSHIVVNPFYRASSPYPPQPDNYRDINGQPVRVDSKNYRVNRPNALLALPFYEELYGADREVLSSSYSIYGIRSYGGYYNIVPSRYEQFVKGLVPELMSDDLKHGIYTNIKDERFLDLAGVGYDYVGRQTQGKTINFRPNALSRFMLFQSYEIFGNDPGAIAKLKSPDFNPLDAVILAQNPGIPSSRTQPAEKLLIYDELSSDDIALEISSKQPAVLLFNDTYHEGWKAFVNGKEQAIITANFTFMATTVPAGTSKVEFKFMPRYFLTSIYVSIFGGAIFFLVVWILYAKRGTLDNAGRQAIQS